MHLAASNGMVSVLDYLITQVKFANIFLLPKIVPVLIPRDIVFPDRLYNKM